MPSDRRFVSGESHHNAKLTANKVVEIKALLDQLVPHREIAKRYGVSSNSINRIASGVTWRDAGSVEPKRRGRRLEVADNFFAHCDQSGGPEACWPWMRARSSGGYGNVWFEGRCQQTNRVAYLLAKGPIPIGEDGETLNVLHKCDNPPCVNPAHLWVGTRKNNANDRDLKQRNNQKIGDERSGSKLTTKEVIFIGRCGDLFSIYEMAKMLGVAPATVAQVKSGRTWAHVIDRNAPLILRHSAQLDDA